MKVQLWYNSEIEPFDDPDNGDWPMTQELWQQLRDSGKVPCEEVDTACLSNEQRIDGYLSQAVPCTSPHRYAIRPVFGRRGSQFGRGIPALFVYEAGSERPTDVYPHKKDDRLVTIQSYLGRLLADLGLEI